MRGEEREGRTLRTGPCIVTLTTDFGLVGPYVAAMKGVLLGLTAGLPLQIVDVCHTIRPQDIREGAFVLAAIVDAFPEGTVHLAVVDPGVGTDRRAIAAAVAGHWFVLPDNGLITAAALGRAPEGIWELTNPALRRTTVAPTFHGRDLFAPAAAHLLRGGDPAEFGPRRDGFLTLPDFVPTALDDGLAGEVLFRDTFGNLVTNIAGARLPGDVAPGRWTIAIAGSRIEGLVRTYGERPAGALVALIGSSGWLEVAVVDGDASARLGVGPGARVVVRGPA
jgi:S-adenosylmethionine hydrolase